MIRFFERNYLASLSDVAQESRNSNQVSCSLSIVMSQPQVLIVGAGPTGLVLGLWLARAGVPFRLIEKNSGPGQASRAMAVQARTLEFYRQLRIADEVIAAGFRLDRLHLRNRVRELTVVPLGDVGSGATSSEIEIGECRQTIISGTREWSACVGWARKMLGKSDRGASHAWRTRNCRGLSFRASFIILTQCIARLNTAKRADP